MSDGRANTALLGTYGAIRGDRPEEHAADRSSFILADNVDSPTPH